MIKRKIVSIVMALLMIVSTVVVVNPVYEVQAASVPDPAAGFEISDAVIKYDGTEISALTEPIMKDATIVLTYTWSIVDTDKVLTGDTISVPVPSVLDFGASDINGSLFGSAGSFGTYTVDVDTGILSLELSDVAGGLSNVSGSVEFTLDYDLEDLVVEVPYEMTIPLTINPDKTYSVKFDMSENDPITKTGQVNSSDGNVIDWIVDINADLQSVDPAVVTDVIDDPGDRLIYTADSMEIYELVVKSDGTVTKGALVDAADYVVTYVDGTKTLEVTFDDPIDRAYRLIYSTDIDPDEIDTSKTTFTYSNEASFNGESDDANVTIERGSIVDKSSSLDNDQQYNTSAIDWSILVNEANYPLTNARVDDDLPSGLSLDLASLKVYTVDASGDKETPALTAGVHYTVVSATAGEFFLNLGNISEDYIIEYTTDVTEAAKNNNDTSLTFNNTATLIQGISDTQTDDTDDQTIKKGEVITKTGERQISYNDAKYINWVVNLNTAEIDLGTSRYTDIIVDTDAHILDIANGFEVYSIDIDESSSSGSQTETLLVENTDYKLVNVSTAGFALDFDVDGDGGDLITTAYRIDYRTQVDKDASYVVNEGYIGDGTGTVSVTTGLNPNISNNFSKAYQDIDYETKVMEWRVTVNPIKEVIEDLVITDVFDDELWMTSQQFNAIEVLKGSSTFTNYDLVATEVGGKIKGFVISFNEDVNNAPYYVDFETTMDPDVTSTDGDLDYKNKVSFASTAGDVSSTKTANPNLPTNVRKNGYKEGSLQREDKEIEWTIYTNLLSKNMEDLVLVDSFNDNQRLVSGSIELTPFTLASGSSLDIVTTSAALSITTMAALGFEVVENSGLDGFTITYPDTINSPYMVTYTTEFYGVSETEYNNSATIGDETYTASVAHPEGDKFISKEGDLIGQDSIDWTLEVNLSQSTISNLLITDRLSAGLAIDLDSFEAKDANGDAIVFEDYFEVTLADKDYLSDPDVIKIAATRTLENTYTISYSTDIYKEDVLNKEVSNDVTIAGDETISGTTSTSETVALSFVTGSGSGSGELGSFTLKKTDTSGNLLEGAVFELYKTYTDDPDKLLGTLTTDASGQASAERLKYATYKLKEITAPDGYVIANEITSFTLNSTTDLVVEVDNLKKAELGNYVWYDLDRDGIQDDGELGVEGVRVNLYTEGTTFVATTTTDADGLYIFTDLDEGVYRIEFLLPDGYSVTVKDSTEASNATDSDGSSDQFFDEKASITSESLSYDDSNMTYDLGIYQSFSLGDYTWIDSDADGLQGSEEEGIDGITLELYDASNDALLDTTVSYTKDGAKGYYIFDDLPMGTYYVKEISSPVYVLTGQDSGDPSTQDGSDSDVDPETSLTGTYTFDASTPEDQRHNPTVDIGYYRLASLGDYVWHDKNYDGSQDSDEEGIEGIKVTLYDSDGKIVQVEGEDYVLTDSDGGYAFNDLVPGDYTLTFELPEDWYLTKDNVDDETDDTVDSDATLQSTTIAVIENIHLDPNEADPTNDVGLYQKASLGDYVWYDKNKDGLQDSDEDPIADVLVTLVPENGDNQTTTTDDNGYYRFDDLDPGSYVVVFDGPNNYELTDQDVSDSLNDDGNDSDASENGETGAYVLESGQHNPTIDAGFYKSRDNSTGYKDDDEVPEEEEVQEVDETEDTEAIEEVVEEEETEEETFTKEEGDEDEADEPSDVIVYKPSEKVKNVTVAEPPTKGTITIEDDGSIAYSPGPDFDGTDKVVLIITNDEGEEEEFILDIFDDLPQAGLLPETGGLPFDLWIGFGTLAIGAGLGMKFRGIRKRT